MDDEFDPAEWQAKFDAWVESGGQVSAELFYGTIDSEEDTEPWSTSRDWH